MKYISKRNVIKVYRPPYFLVESGRDYKVCIHKLALLLLPLAANQSVKSLIKR